MFRTLLIIVSVCAVTSCDNLNRVNIFNELFNNNDINDEQLSQKSYDFIIVGAGSAGSVVANRLSENHKWSVLLLEAGGHENVFTDIPLLATLQSITSYDWGYKGKPSNTSCLSLRNRRCTVPRGKALGGSSVINFLVYSRGNKLDYEEWENLGNEGWGYKDVLPYFIKSENCSYVVEADKNFHGYEGYLNVQYPQFHTPLRDEFIKAGLNMGFRNTDPNGYIHVGFSKVQATLQNGKRHSTAKAYLTPVRNRPNLKILTGARVTKILIDPKEKTAYGVEFIKNDKMYLVWASREIILSSGAINTPQLLMLSGIGPLQDLKRLDIPVIQDLKVGYNLQDHVSYTQNFLINDSVNLSYLEISNPIHLLNYTVYGKGPMTLPGGSEALAFIKTRLNVNKDYDYPDIELVLAATGINSDFLGNIRKGFNFPDNVYFEIYGPVLFTRAFSITIFLLRPRSRGRVTIRDSNPLHPPVIYLNYLQDRFDVEVMVEGLRMAKQVGESEGFQKYNSKIYLVPLSACKQFALGSDEHYACSVRNIGVTSGHHVGTCKMGPANDPDAVIDPQLRVYGIKRLRVVDGSIMPNIITGHTNAPIIMIGEKASDMIKSAWGYNI